MRILTANIQKEKNTVCFKSLFRKINLEKRNLDRNNNSIWWKLVF